MSDYEILKYQIGEETVQSISSIAFLGWVAKKLNNTTQSGPYRHELAMAISNPPMGRLSDETKISYVRKLIRLGVEL